MSGSSSPISPSGHGTSTNPVREALQLLRGEGFVIISPNRGARVRPIDQDFVRDIYEIGVLIEPALTRWFVGMATDADIAELERIQGLIEANNFADPIRHSELDTAVPHPDVPAPLQPARRRAVVEASRGAARRQPPLQLHAGPPRRRCMREHRELIELHQGTATPTRPPRLIARHVEGSGRHILEQMRAAAPPAPARLAPAAATDVDLNEKATDMKITGVKPWLVKASALLLGRVPVRRGDDRRGHHAAGARSPRPPRSPTARCAPSSGRSASSSPARTRARSSGSGTRSSAASPTWAAAAPPCECVSAIDIALWDIRGKALGQPIYELLGGPVRDEIALYTHPDQSKFTSKEGVVAEIQDIVESGHTALKFDPFPSRASGRQAREQRDGYLDGSMTRKDEREAAELTALIRETAGPDIEILIDAHGRFDVPTAIRLCRTLEEAGNIDWFEEPVPARELQRAQAGARQGQRRRSRGASAATPSGTSCRSSRTSSPTTSCPTSPGPAASPSSRRSRRCARPTTSRSRRTTRRARSTSSPARR